MADPSTTRATIRQKTIKKLYAPRFPIVGTTTGTGTTTTLLDNILAPSGQIEDFNGAFIYIASKNASGPAIGEVARVTNIDFSGSTSTLTTAPAFTAALPASETYEIHYEFHPTEINDRINELLENIRGWVFVPLSGLLTNGNFNTAISSWTDSGTTSAYNSTAAYILFGTGSLGITAASAITDYIYQRVYVSANTPLLVSTYAYVDAANSGTTAEIELWDVTNGVQIGESANTSSFNEWVHLQFLATVPATCKQVEVRLLCSGTTGTVYYDSAQLIRRDQQVHTLPSDFDWPEDFDIVQYFPTGDPITVGTSTNAYRTLQYPVEKWSDAEILRDPRGTATRLQLISGRSASSRDSSGRSTPDWGGRSGGGDIDHPLFIRGRVDYPTVSSDTTLIYAPEDYIVNLLFADLIEELAYRDLDEDKYDSYTLKMQKANDVREKIAFLARNNSNDKVTIRGTFNG